MIELSDGTIYITYLHKRHGKFKPENINMNLSIDPVINKPLEAFWGCPKDSLFGWKEWCEAERFGAFDYNWDNPVKWKLKTGSRILKIELKDVIDETNSILKKYIKQNSLHPSTSNFFFNYGLDFNKIKNDNIDAIELADGRIGHCFINELEVMFNSWDCESIVVLNKNKIQILN